ncbi:RecQ family ATP-dependent DNA helicase [Granulicella sp. S156]|uniref:RecQ family ATP-dependent DNA helicase n=1 Tax=Granulicella sp. S156 TaxID=1747224 RepID=UPI00131BF3BC|nr:RecQ family ATP-dependent DNA helicase [Granulicella sp. S156]
MATPSPTRDLSELLHSVFGHREFRAHQREVCEAAASGRDVLLVMPTGAGKSLCYQLPALALGGTALVISPLIALMDDQSSKLTELGLRVARIHSGLSRDDSRQACRDYLAGELDFLFIAPERMRVPGFPEMLAKRKPALIAIDEAHCISQWGHDFRPDYRTLGQHLLALRPSPIIALTATATPTVQQDIAHQLNLQSTAIFITGFRRSNLAVEVVELSKPQRDDFALKLLKEPSARPAIIYAASRKSAEELAGKLHKHFPTAAYHAGLDAATRDRVQRAFLSGKLDVVVATVAFGMGIDKADVRTVIHVALPGSVEAYYQEIGRAGRDGLPSRTILLHGFADRRLQEFFLEKNYPPTSDLERVSVALTDEYVQVESLQRKLKIDRETLDRTIEKLLAAGVALMDMAGDVRGTGETTWQKGYESQVAIRRAQIDRMIAFAESNSCRMAALVQHFGDTSDKAQSCGLCDVCNPSGNSANAAHQPSQQEREWLREILSALDKRSTSTGKLFTDLHLMKDRKDFDTLLDALARAGLISLANDTFRNPEGRDITYKKASITHEGREPDDATLDTVWIRGSLSEAPSAKKKSSGKSRGATPSAEKQPLNPEAEQLFERLRHWRTEVAKPTKTPAFMILADAVMRAIANHAPKNLSDLHAVPGMGPAKVDRYGAAILAVCRGEAVPSISAPKVKEPNPSVQRSLTLQPSSRAQPAQHNSESQPSRPAASSAVRPAPKPAPPAPPPAELTPNQQALDTKLRDWRKQQATQTGLPSFFIFSDTVLHNIVVAEPRSLSDLRTVRGIDTEKLERFGAAVVELCRE